MASGVFFLIENTNCGFQDWPISTTRYQLSGWVPCVWIPCVWLDSVRFAGVSVFVNLHAWTKEAPSAIRQKKKGSTPHVANQAFGLRILRHFRDFCFYILTFREFEGPRQIRYIIYILGDLGCIHAMILDLSLSLVIFRREGSQGKG